jgi:hypothetical protein
MPVQSPFNLTVEEHDPAEREPFIVHAGANAFTGPISGAGHLGRTILEPYKFRSPRVRCWLCCVGDSALVSKADDALGVAFGLTFVIWSSGGVLGAVYWAVQGSVIQVILSLLVPMWGVASVVWDLLAT